MINALQKVPHLMWTSYNKRKNTEIYYFKNKCAYLKRKEEKKNFQNSSYTRWTDLKNVSFFFHHSREHLSLKWEVVSYLCPNRRAADSTCQHIYFTPLHLNCHTSIHFPKHLNEYWYTCSFNAQGCTDLYELFSDKATCRLWSLIWNSSFR